MASSPVKPVNGDVKPTNGVSAEEAVDAKTKFLRGKREYLIGDYGAAVKLLAEACEELSAEHGDLADELGDVYLFYGKALFANARSESGVLGDKIEKDTEEVEEDDEEGGEDEPEEENEAEEAKTADGAAMDAEEGKEKKEEVTEDKAKEAEAPSTNGIEEKANGEEGEGEGEEKEGEEDVEDLQLSWEVLEMAKVIFSKKADQDKEAAIKLSEVYLALGENGLESESYTTAVMDMQTCLDLQINNMAADDRRIAETLYQIGVAHSMAESYDDANSNFHKSIAQLEKRLASLNKAKTDGKKHPDDEKVDSFYTIDGEVTEINEAIKEIREKITDMEESKKHLKEEMAKRLAQGFGSSSSDGASTSSNAGSSSSAAPAPSSAATTSAPAVEKPVSNISHLIRKKRKNDEEENVAVEKKVKIDDEKPN